MDFRRKEAGLQRKFGLVYGLMDCEGNLNCLLSLKRTMSYFNVILICLFFFFCKSLIFKIFHF